MVLVSGLGTPQLVTGHSPPATASQCPPLVLHVTVTLKCSGTPSEHLYGNNVDTGGARVLAQAVSITKCWARSVHNGVVVMVQFTHAASKLALRTFEGLQAQQHHMIHTDAEACATQVGREKVLTTARSPFRVTLSFFSWGELLA